ncbi:hypothetical protein [Acinetobacter variabilis]|uniref:hypothetical protein n=1 Tax=Acinetobacter variabilis TaxID=70346 RepID=UPI0030FAFBC3
MTMTLQEHSETGMEFYQYCQQEFDAELSKFKTKLGKKKSALKYHSKYITVDEFFEDREKYKVADSSGKCNSIKTSHNFTRCIPT